MTNVKYGSVKLSLSRGNVNTNPPEPRHVTSLLHLKHDLYPRLNFCTNFNIVSKSNPAPMFTSIALVTDRKVKNGNLMSKFEEAIGVSHSIAYQWMCLSYTAHQLPAYISTHFPKNITYFNEGEWTRFMLESRTRICPKSFLQSLAKGNYCLDETPFEQSRATVLAMQVPVHPYECISVPCIHLSLQTYLRP